MAHLHAFDADKSVAENARKSVHEASQRLCWARYGTANAKTAQADCDTGNTHSPLKKECRNCHEHQASQTRKWE